MSSDLATTLQTLYARFGELSGVQIEIHKSLPAITVTNDKASATIFLQGAQVSEYQKHGQKPTLFLSDANRFLPDVPLRGGIPICWPWFGDIKRNPEAIQQQLSNIEQAPAHGFVRSLQWQLDDIVAQPELTTLTLSLEVSPETHENWPYHAHLKLEVRVGETLQLALSVTNTGEKVFQYSLALHTYLAVDSLDHVEVTGLEDCTYFDSVNDWQAATQETPLIFTQETDRVYPQAKEIVTLLAKDTGQQVVIHNEALPSVVAWNPWIEKSMTLSDFNPQDYTKMACLESAALLDAAPVLTPKRSIQHTLTITHNLLT